MITLEVLEDDTYHYRITSDDAEHEDLEVSLLTGDGKMLLQQYEDPDDADDAFQLIVLTPKMAYALLAVLKASIIEGK